MSGWFYNDVSGSLNRVPTALEAPYLIPGTGWHELQISYNATRAQAAAAAAAEFPSSAKPGAPLVSNLGSAAGNAVTGAVGNVLGLPSFTSSGWRSYALRGLKIVLGVVLVIVGLVQLTHAQNLVSSASTVAKAVA